MNRRASLLIQAARLTFAVTAGCASLQLFAAKSIPINKMLTRTQAVAHVRVTKLAEELEDNTVQHTVTFSVCGTTAGLGELKELDARFSPTPKPDKANAEPVEPLFVVGGHNVVLLARQNNHWQIVCRLRVTAEGKFVDPGVGEDIGLKPDTEADAVVQLIAEKINKASPTQKERPKPPPTARNQPWNLMRASPLRRVWPFFPR